MDFAGLAGILITRRGVCHLSNGPETENTSDREELLEELEALRRRVAELETGRAAGAADEEQVYRTLFDGVWDGVLVADLSTKKFKLANRAICDMLGYTEKELLNLTVMDIHHENDLEYAVSVFEAQARGEIELGKNIPCLRKDGKIIFTDVRTRKISFGGIDCNVGIFTDITEHKIVESETRAREERIRRHQSAILKLLGTHDVTESNFRETMMITTEIAAEAMETDRVGVWIISEDGSRLICLDQYVRSTLEHNEGAVLSTTDYPNYFKAVRSSRAIHADDAQSDPRTSEFTESYLVPNGITSMMDAGIRVRGKTVGVVCFEHVGMRRNWKSEESSFAGEIADQAAKAMMALEQAEAEAKLRESEVMFRALTEYTSDITVILGNDRKYEYISPSISKIFFYSQGEVLGHTVETFLHPEDWPSVEEVLNAADKQPYFSFTMPVFRARRKDGKWVTLEGLVTSMPDVPGVYGLVVNCRDVTDRREAQLARDASERFLANVFDSIQDGISVLDKDLHILRVNHVMKEWYKENLPLEGRKCYHCYHNAEAPCGVCPTRRCFETGKTETDVVPGLPGSPVEWVELYSFPFRDPETGEVAGAVEYVRDITERKRAEEIIHKHREHLEELVTERTTELRMAQEKLVESERLAVLGQFAGSIAHEIRNPLGVISNSAYYLKMVCPAGNSKVARHLEIISDQIRNTTGIIESILKLTRMEEPSKERLNLCTLLLICVAAAEIPERITVETIFENEEIYINADRDQLRIVFRNILKNAVQAVDGKGRIKIKALLENGRAVITLSDTGPGMTEDVTARAFVPLFTTKAYGIGFGLTIVKMVVEKHGGEIMLESEPGKGSSFIISLPAET